MLQHCCNPLKTHARIDARLWQGRQRTRRITLKLHEHQIPDLNVTIAVFFWGPRWATPNLWTVIKEYFRARTAWARVCHLPEIIRRIAGAFVITNAHDARRRHTDFFFPNCVGLVILLIDGNP